MSCAWLLDRAIDVEEASKRYNANQPTGPDCSDFLKAFEKQLHNQLHLKNLLVDGLVLPIKKGCYQKAEQLMKESLIRVTGAPTPSCDCSIIFLYKNKLHFSPTVSALCRNLTLDSK